LDLHEFESGKKITSTESVKDSNSINPEELLSPEQQKMVVNFTNTA
jgi:hypothetical protein